MAGLRWNAPLDPQCPVVKKHYKSHANDPISQMCGCLDDIHEAFERKHRAECKRCQEYGVANIGVVSG